MTCKIIDNDEKRKIAFYNFLLVWGLFCFFAHPAIYGLTAPAFKTYSGGSMWGVVVHGFLAGLIAGLVTYFSMPSGTHRSCEIDK